MRDKPFVGVHGCRRERTDRFEMFEDSTDKMLCHLAKSVLTVGVVEKIFPVFEEAQMKM